jgi:hypothetical protein
MDEFKRKDGQIDRKRRHPHFLVRVIYTDAAEFGRVYHNKTQAEKFAARQKRCPLVKEAVVLRTS